MEPLETMQEGQELWADLEMVDESRFVTLPPPEMTPALEALIETAKQSQGVLADNAAFDQALEDMKKDWEAWNRRLSS